MHQLSKSDYLKFRVHPAYLWYKKHKRDVLPAPTENDKYAFKQGHEFEAFAQQLFPGAQSVIAEPWEYDKLLDQTERLMDDSSVSTIFQASFKTDGGLFCRSDVIERVDEGWILSEIKSSTSVKQSHVYDVAFQKMVMELLGFKVISCRVIHVNKFYKKQEEIKVDSITAIRDVTEQVEEVLPVVQREAQQAQVVCDQKEIDDHPAFAGSLNEWLPIYRHIYSIPDNSVFNFAQLSPQQVRMFNSESIKSIEETPSSQLTKKQLIQQQAWQAEEPLVDSKKIKAFLDSLEFPLYFLDYETSAYVLPFYKGTKPYQQVPFQYSLHVLRSPDAELEHFEYLHPELSLPVPDLCQKMIPELGTSGTVMAWFDKFEKYCNRTMAQLEPEYREPLVAINERMLDLRVPFANYGYVHKLFNGSTSIKNVLPVMVPELSYKDLDIQEGGAAQRLWQQVVTGDKTDDKKEIFDNLLAYCKLDTLAMVKIYQKLVDINQQADTTGSSALEQEIMF